MKKVLAIILIVLFLLIVLCACSGKVEIAREAVDWSYTPPYEGIETEYVYKYNVLKGEFVLVPEVKTIRHEAIYEILYRVAYDNGSVAEVWETVTAEEFERLTQ